MSVSEFLIAYVQLSEVIAALTPPLWVMALVGIAAAARFAWKARGDIATYRRVRQRFAAVRA